MKQWYEQPMVCPLDPRNICPLSLQNNTDQMDKMNKTYMQSDPQVINTDNTMELYQLMSQRPQNVNRIMGLLNRELGSFYSELQGRGVQRFISSRIFENIVSFVIQNERNYTGTVEQKTSQLFNAFRIRNIAIYYALRGFGLSDNRINQIIRAIIEIVLRRDQEAPTPPRPTPPRPTPPRPTPRGWSAWEDLGGILTSAPAVSSWQPNRLDVFGRGQNQALWHIYWDGARWSSWEDLGGILTSAPAAVSWGPNRIDVFGVGQNQALWHIYWDGRRWSSWEDLGGVLTSAPAVSSWQSNRLDVFGRGQNQALWHKYWDGSRWSNWEDLGGILTSPPAAVSWGPNRIDTFARGQNQSLWHKYWDGSRWSSWEDLGGGAISYGPAAASTGVNRLEVFASGPQGQLVFRTWNGRNWSSWENLGGVITSEPAAVSWGGNRLDAFARGQNNHLWHIWRP